jgi:hypothetical protein
MTIQAGNEYEENVLNYCKYFRQYIKADEFSEIGRKVSLGVSLGNEK